MRKFDIIVWGASGFTGQLVAEYLHSQYGVGRDVKWAISGRNADKLNELKRSFRSGFLTRSNC